jgi:3-oxoacyl-[acyl-carrier protein] reductase
MQDQPLSGKIALVTGAGRRQGIGHATCRALAVAGADVFFTTWQPYDAAMPWGADREGPSRLVDELRGQGVYAGFAEVDLSQPDVAPALFDAVEAWLGGPSILVNNAAHSELGGWETLDAGMLDRHYAVNLRAAALLSAEFARRFRLGEGGRIINLTSGQSLGPMPGELAYAATKGAVEALTASLAPDLMARGITVNAVNPGPTDTGWMDESLKGHLQRRFPTGRVGTAEDAARLIAFLASPEAGWITGQIINSEGGFVRG